MSDFRNDPNFVRNELTEYDSRIQWAAVAVILLLVGGLIVGAAYTGGDSQTAMKSPAAETTGSGGSMGSNDLGSTATSPSPIRQRP
jgi:hypothetical protein